MCGRKAHLLDGQRVGAWTIIRLHGRRADVVCDCGNKRELSRTNLLYGKSLSCKKCDTMRRSKHGNPETRDRLAMGSWKAMIDRCTKPSCKDFARYGARGIRVCERWLKSFPDFSLDMGRKPSGYSIDRIDVTGNYEPSNCRWADRKTQQRNKTNNRMITVNGQTKTIAEWAEVSGLKWKTLVNRIRREWPEHLLLSPTLKTWSPWHPRGIKNLPKLTK